MEVLSPNVIVSEVLDYECEYDVVEGVRGCLLT